VGEISDKGDTWQAGRPYMWPTGHRLWLNSHCLLGFLISRPLVTRVQKV
jgi:hypothetical protein